MIDAFIESGFQLQGPIPNWEAAIAKARLLMPALVKYIPNDIILQLRQTKSVMEIRSHFSLFPIKWIITQIIKWIHLELETNNISNGLAIKIRYAINFFKHISNPCKIRENH